MSRTAIIYTVSNYQLTASNGRPIRKATQVQRSDGKTIKFMDRMSKWAAIAQAEREWAK